MKSQACTKSIIFSSEKVSIYITLILTLIVSGCASTQKLSDEDRKRINVIKIDDSVTKPPKMGYIGQGQAIGAGFGIVGALVAHSLESSGDSIQKSAESNGVLIEK